MSTKIERENKWIKSHLDDIYFNEIYLFSDEYIQQCEERAEEEAKYYAEHPELIEEQEESEEDRLHRKINEAIWAGDVETIKECFPKIDKDNKDDKDNRKTDGMQNPENSVQDADSLPEIADNSEQSKTEQNKADENKGLPPLTPPTGEDVDVWRRYSFIEFPGYAYNKNTYNLECLLLSLENLHIKDPDEIKAILKLSDYGRLGNEVWKIIHNTKWSMVNNNGKYVIGALNKTRKQG